jgi:murein L,D-transpeptidase YcbB/YkuD
MVKPSLKRSLCAVLALTLTPASASATIDASGAATAASASLHAGLLRAADVPGTGRYVVVDAASARLFMVADGRVQDSMRVVVGKPSSPTPALRSTLRFATVNPYWHVPADLAATIIAPRVLADGAPYLRERGYQIVSGFSEDAQVLPPEWVDWRAVADGRGTVHIRQLPGPANSMGRIKFAVTDADGIYLHDTPNRDLFTQAERGLSNGCVRLEDAPRLARWLLGHDPAAGSAAPEQLVALPGPVPIIIAYLGRDARMAQLP